MTRQRLRILDLDASLPEQEPVRERLADGRARRLDLSGLGSALRLWSSARDWRRLEAALAEDEAANGAPFLTMIGSGDYHHVSAALIARAPGPLTVIHFDNHPDWCRCFPARHCGGWVNMALAQSHVRRVVTLGPCADDLNRPDRKGANLNALSNSTLQVFPWDHPPTLSRREVADGAGHHCRNGLILWRNLVDEDFRAFLRGLIETLPTKRIWITVDKDVLALDEAVTNWDQGRMPLARVVEAIQLLGERCEIVGADLCGYYAPARQRHPMKLAEAWMDQPRRAPKGGVDAARRRNEQTNTVLLGALEAFA